MLFLRTMFENYVHDYAHHPYKCDTLQAMEHRILVSKYAVALI